MDWSLRVAAQDMRVHVCAQICADMIARNGILQRKMFSIVQIGMVLGEQNYNDGGGGILESPCLSVHLFVCS